MVVVVVVGGDVWDVVIVGDYILVDVSLPQHMPHTLLDPTAPGGVGLDPPLYLI